jgi:disulfide bond formation protein DsbB
MDRRTTTLLALAVLALALIPLGIAVFVLGFLMGDSPCILCWAQRIGMGLVALLGAFILRYGPRPRYVGLGILVGAFGVYMALRHSALHLARDVGQGFSLEILGAHTYSWSLLIYWSCVVVMGLLLLRLREDDLRGGVRDLGRLGRVAIGTLALTLGANALQAFISVGPPPFVGPGDPIRFSWNPRNWAWTLEEFQGPGPSLRGSWAIARPDPVGTRTSPFTGLPTLAPVRWIQLPAEVRGPVADLAFDAGTDRFLVSTEGHRVYLLDGAFGQVQRWTRVDPGFSVDLGRAFVGAAFLGDGRLLALAENKSYVLLAEAQEPGKPSWRHFLENGGAFLEQGRGRFATVRARLNYVSSLALDPGRGLYTAAVPNPSRKALVISRFDPKDLVLSEEFVARLGPEGPQLAPGRSLSDLLPVGLTAHGDNLLLLSPGVLLELDPRSQTILRGWSLGGVDRPVGLATRNGEIHVLCADGRIAVLAGLR